VSGGQHGALFGLHVATVEVKQRLGLSGDPSKSLLWVAPVEAGHRPTVVELLGTRRKPLSAVASDLAILTQDQLELAIRRRGRRTTLTKAEVGRLEDWTVDHLSYTTGALRDGAVPFDSWVEEVTRRLQPPMARHDWWSSAFQTYVATKALVG